MAVVVMNHAGIIDFRRLSSELQHRSPAITLLRAMGHGVVHVHVLPSPSFVARTVKVTDSRFEVTLSAGVWIAIHYLLSQEPSTYESDVGNATGRAVDTIAKFSDDGRVRIAKVEDIGSSDKKWHWSLTKSQFAHEIFERFMTGYFEPWRSNRAVDRRIELAVAFIAMHEYWHVVQDHFRQFPSQDRLHDKRIEMLADLRAGCMFPGLVSNLADQFGIAGKKRCNQLIASGFSIACAILCFQALQRFNPGSGTHPDPLWRFGALMLTIASDGTGRDITNEDRDYLVAGMYVLLNSFAQTAAQQQMTTDDLDAAMGVHGLEAYLLANPSPFMEALAKHYSISDGDSKGREPY